MVDSLAKARGGGVTLVRGWRPSVAAFALGRLRAAGLEPGKLDLGFLGDGWQGELSTTADG